MDLISLSCKKSLTFLSYKLFCLMKVAMHWSEHTILLALPARNSLVLKSKVAAKFLSHSCRSAGVFRL